MRFEVAAWWSAVSSPIVVVAAAADSDDEAPVASASVGAAGDGARSSCRGALLPATAAPAPPGSSIASATAAESIYDYVGARGQQEEVTCVQ